MRCWPAAAPVQLAAHLSESVVYSAKTFFYSTETVFYSTETFGHLFSQGVEATDCGSPEVAELADELRDIAVGRAG